MLVVSPYPKQGETYSTGISGVASYAKNVISEMPRRVVVLTNYLDKPSSYEEDNTLVIRCFQTSGRFMLVAVLPHLRQFTEVKQVLIQLDSSLYMGMLRAPLMLFFLCILACLRYNVAVVLHHVILDIMKISGHVGLVNSTKGRFLAQVYNSFFHIFYKALNLLTSLIIVPEEPLKSKFKRIVPNARVLTIPIGVDTNLFAIDKKKARRLLGIDQDAYVILFFGFVNWFKGADFFAKTFANTKQMLGKRVHFIIAGGVSATMQDKAYYQKYFSSVEKIVGASQTVTITGYVPQEKIALYFSACDLVTFPYRYFMTPSAVLSLTFSYNKPFIISDALCEMFDADDLASALKQARIPKKDLIFELNGASFHARTRKVLRNGIRSKITHMTHIIREQRSYKNTALLYDQALFAQSPYLLKSLALEYTTKQ